MRKVLITGITGFLGADIASKLIAQNIQVIGLKRPESNTWRCKEIFNQIIWIDIDNEGKYKNELQNLSIDSIIHCAWIGVEANERDNLSIQSKNIFLLVDILNIAKEVKINKFIYLGSQAEYGNIDGIINEKSDTVSLNAYGSIKLACQEIVKSFCFSNNITWVWLRIFSVFGEKENQTWLIPSLVKSIQENKEMNFTLGEQKYAYLYIDDFSTIIYRIIDSEIESGIYNISSNITITIRSLIESIKNKIDPDFKLNFGSIPYRENQSMHMEGDINKITTQIGDIKFTNFQTALDKTINYYLKNKNK